MENHSSFFKNKLFDSFYRIMYDEEFSDRRRKRIRIFFFSYYFGAVTADSLSIIFYDDEELSKKNYSEARNCSMSILRYLASKDLMKQLASDTYILSSKGAIELFNQLLSMKLMSKEDENEFRINQRDCQVHANHASNNGVTVLQFLRHKRYPFEVEPFISCSGEIMPSHSAFFSQKLLSPDAYIYASDNCERYYIETDNCEERLGTQLVPKLQNYQSAVLSANEGTCLEKTILFSIWHKQGLPKVDSEFGINCNEAVSLIDFFATHFSAKITCNELLDALNHYSGNSALICNTQKTIQEICEFQNTTYASIKDTIEFRNLLRAVDKKFVARRETIFKSIPRVSGLKTALLNGTRLICLPIYNQIPFYKFLFFELENHVNFVSLYLRKIHNFSCNISYSKFKIFQDLKSGENYTFRNVFECQSYKSSSCYIFENITDDFGGYFRVENFLKKRCVSIQENICLVCIYNEALVPDPGSYFRLPEDKRDHVKFISYIECIQTIFFS